MLIRFIIFILCNVSLFASAGEYKLVSYVDIDTSGTNGMYPPKCTDILTHKI